MGGEGIAEAVRDLTRLCIGLFAGSFVGFAALKSAKNGAFGYNEIEYKNDVDGKIKIVSGIIFTKLIIDNKVSYHIRPLIIKNNINRIYSKMPIYNSQLGH